MEVVYKGTAIEDIDYWKKSENMQIQKKISILIEDIQLHPETGLGKPERLKHEYSAYWSRRIDDKNRIIYKVYGNQIHILSLKGHY